MSTLIILLLWEVFLVVFWLFFGFGFFLVFKERKNNLEIKGTYSNWSHLICLYSHGHHHIPNQLLYISPLHTGDVSLDCNLHKMQIWRKKKDAKLPFVYFILLIHCSMFIS